VVQIIFWLYSLWWKWTLIWLGNNRLMIFKGTGLDCYLFIHPITTLLGLAANWAIHGNSIVFVRLIPPTTARSYFVYVQLVTRFESGHSYHSFLLIHLFLCPWWICSDTFMMCNIRRWSTSCEKLGIFHLFWCLDTPGSWSNGDWHLSEASKICKGFLSDIIPSYQAGLLWPPGSIATLAKTFLSVWSHLTRLDALLIPV
jgi:hypothetical protein